MEDFFEDYNGETQVVHQNNQVSSYIQNNEYANIAMNTTLDTHSIPQYNQPNLELNDHLTLTIRQQEKQINDKLRLKANQEYEEKERRREEGRKQLQNFKEKKYREKEQRKQENIRNEELNKISIIKQGEQSSWKKVGLSVPLKQGEYKGQKDINRMREAIIHKKDDQN